MHFDEGRSLNHPYYSESESRSRFEHQQQRREDSSGGNGKAQHPGPGTVRLETADDWQTEGVLDAANNKLQELMQLLYLLGRDPRVPQDARYHVTLAQSEIALLTRLMQNSAEAYGARAERGGEANAFAAGSP